MNISQELTQRFIKKVSLKHQKINQSILKKITVAF